MLDYFARVIKLNVKRTGMQVRILILRAVCRLYTVFKVDPATVATDSFLFNLSAVLLQFAEPFMDANYTKVRVSLQGILLISTPGSRWIESILVTTHDRVASI